MYESTDLDPLVRMAVGHYQFEAIHPFTDGNGRTGRILNSLFLIQENLLTLPILYLSQHILRRRADYYRFLQAVTCEQRWEEWILYMLQGVAETAAWTTAKIDAIQRLAEHTTEHVRAKLPKAPRHELINLIFELPYCRIQNVIDARLAERQTASRYLQKLVEIGVLQLLVVGRDKLFVHPKLIKLLIKDGNEFAPYPK
ncbi:MAG: Fic family protein [Pirellulales bacterium]|nr:Fic family protein [Pirellulales bacterium]